VYVDGPAAGGSDARAFLAAVLQSEEAKKGEPAGFLPGNVDADDATLFPGVVKGVTELGKGKLVTHVPILRLLRGLVNGRPPGLQGGNHPIFGRDEGRFQTPPRCR
jgi:hypothetical protein